MWNNHDMTWSTWPATTVMVALMVIVAVVVILAIQSADGRTSRSADARRILDARLAKGEIDPEEYEVRREALTRS